MMTTTTMTLEERVAALEATVSEMQQAEHAAEGDAPVAIDSSLEDRVALLEKLVAELRKLPASHPNAWLAGVVGKITDVEAFDEAMALGREYRRTGKILDVTEDQP